MGRGLTFCSLSRTGLPLRLRRLQFWTVSAIRLVFSAFGGAPPPAGVDGLRPLWASLGVCPPFKCEGPFGGLLLAGVTGWRGLGGGWVEPEFEGWPLCHPFHQQNSVESSSEELRTPRVSLLDSLLFLSEIVINLLKLWPD